MRKTVVVLSKRTPVGSFQGSLSSLSAPQLGSLVIKNILEETKIDPENVDEVILGNVLSAGVGQAPARQAALLSGLTEHVECLTINKVCGSGLKAVMLADQAIKCGDADVVIAGGMESMSNVPYILPKARGGYRLGHGEVVDGLVKDGLWDVYNDFHMGNCAESCAKDFSFTREQLDEFAIESYNRAIKANKNGVFKNEIVPVTIKNRRGDVVVTEDEEINKVKFDKIPNLRPAFDRDGVVTAANASKINDGAAAMLVMSEEKALELGLTPLFEIVAHASAAKKPIEFTTAPADSIKKVLAKAKMQIDEIDLFEINEAFAVVSLAVNEILGLKTDIINVNGGAIAIGHPIGASGARIFVTLMHEMLKRKLDYGLASLCIGGGEAASIIIKSYKNSRLK
ncbi:MAG: acetyl-CoA C-acetyltransferase [Ignavibacteriae bacterium]|nr:acetyl-CoA C-acetyltransferase [Ignavibacteriota bacterium]